MYLNSVCLGSLCADLNTFSIFDFPVIVWLYPTYQILTQQQMNSNPATPYVKLILQDQQINPNSNTQTP